MIPFILWFNPNRNEIKWKGKKYLLNSECKRKVTFLNYLRILITIGLIVLGYFAGIFEKSVLGVFGIMFFVQLVFLGVFWIVLPKEIEKIIG